MRPRICFISQNILELNSFSLQFRSVVCLRSLDLFNLLICFFQLFPENHILVVNVDNFGFFWAQLPLKVFKLVKLLPVALINFLNQFKLIHKLVIFISFYNCLFMRVHYPLQLKLMRRTHFFHLHFQMLNDTFLSLACVRKIANLSLTRSKAIISQD